MNKAHPCCLVLCAFVWLLGAGMNGAVAQAAEFDLNGPTIELRKVQFCEQCNSALVVTTIPEGARIQCPHCSRVQKRIPRAYVLTKLYQVCPRCSSRLDVQAFDAGQRIRCGTCGLHQPVQEDAILSAKQKKGLGYIPGLHMAQPELKPRKHQPRDPEKRLSEPALEGPELDTPAQQKTAGQNEATDPLFDFVGRPFTDNAAATTDSTAALREPTAGARPATRFDTATNPSDTAEMSGVHDLPPPPLMTDTKSLEPTNTDAALTFKQKPLNDVKIGPDATNAVITAPPLPITEDAPAEHPFYSFEELAQQSMNGVTEDQDESEKHLVPAKQMAADPLIRQDHHNESGFRDAAMVAEAFTVTPEDFGGQSKKRLRTENIRPLASNTEQGVQQNRMVTDPETDLRVAGLVNDEIIATADVEIALNMAMEQVRMQLGRKSFTAEGVAFMREKRNALRKQVMQDLVDRAVVKDAARRLGIRFSNEEILRYAQSLRLDGMAAGALPASVLQEARFARIVKALRERFGQAEEPTTEDCFAYFQKHREQYMMPPRVGLTSLIVFRHRGNRPDQRSAPEIMRTVVAALDQGTPYEVVLDTYAEAPYNQDEGWVKLAHDNMVTLPVLHSGLQDVLQEVKEGDIIGPIALPNVFALCRVEILRPAAPRPFEDVQADIYNHLLRERQNAAFATWLNTQRQSADIELY